MITTRRTLLDTAGALLERQGYHAASLAVVITAAIDGAFILCRAADDDAPLRQTAIELASLLRSAQPGETTASATGGDA